MRKALQLLALLADGQKHAGADLATSLGGSRAAIWNQVQRLREVGIEVEADRTHGYRLTHPFEPLSEDTLNAEFLSASERRLTATVVPVIDSTNGSLIGPAHSATYMETCCLRSTKVPAAVAEEIAGNRHQEADCGSRWVGGLLLHHQHSPRWD